MSAQNKITRLVQLAEKSHRFGSLKRVGIVSPQDNADKLGVVFKEKKAAKQLEHARMHCSYGL